MIMKIVIFIMLFIGGAFSARSVEINESRALAKAEDKVESLFDDLKAISNRNIATSKISKIKYTFEEYFVSKELDCPNEFKNILTKRSGVLSLKTDIRPDRYFNLFFQVFRDSDNRNYSFSYYALNSCLVKEPEFKNNEAPAELAQVVIRKTYLEDNTPFAVFEDTLVVGLKEMKIRAWANHSSTHYIGYFGGDVLELEKLKVGAALAYSREQYAKAYQIYQTIVDRYPEEGDSYYRMAIMLYKKNYGSNMNKKYRQTLILNYLNKAIECGSSSTRRCADNMKYWLTC